MSSPHPDSSADSLFISVVLPVRNEEMTIEGVLNSLCEQEYPAERMEILVCDGFSDDRTREIVQRIAEQDKRVRLLENPGRLSSAGRNVGYRSARGDVILYFDGHCVIPSTKLLQSVTELFESTGAACLCRARPLVADDQSGLWAQAIAAVRASQFGHSQNSYIYSDHEGYISPVSVGAAYSRQVFETIGEYDESFDACEDVEFNVRVEKAGFKAYISPRLKILYHARSGLQGLFTQMQRDGRGRFHLLRKHSDYFEWQTLIPVVFVIGCLFAVLAFLTISQLRPPILALSILGYLGLLAVAIAGDKSGSRHGWPLYPLVFITIYSGLGIGFIQAAIQDSFRDAVHVGPERKSSPKDGQ